MNQLQEFRFNDNEVRTVTIDNEPWFVLKDVCDILELTTPSRVAERLEIDEVSQTHIIDSLGRNQETLIINESGLYAVILRSDKPQAKTLRKWVTSEVLPSIRKTGGYQVPQSPMQALELFFKASKETNERMDRVETEFQDVKEIITLTTTDWRKETSSLVNKIAQALGGNEFIKTVREESYTIIQDRMRVNLEQRLVNKRRRMAEEGISKSKREATNYLDVIGEDKKVLECYILVIKEMAVKYGIRKVE